MHQQSQDGAHSTTAGSWIDIGPQPSSPSLSSAVSRIITTDLYIGPHRRNSPRSWRVFNHNSQPNCVDQQPIVGESSQEEYDESESEPDQVLMCSSEDIRPLCASERTTLVEYSDLASSQQCFTPQPNAFSHPPSAFFQSRDLTRGPYFRSAREPQPQSCALAPQSRRNGHLHSCNVSSGHQVDQDAALRASLNTLLSCAAAARGLPQKPKHQPSKCNQTNLNRDQPAYLRIVPESVLLGHGNTGDQCQSTRLDSQTGSSQSCGKQKHRVPRSENKDGRCITKISKPALEDVPAPTLLTWVVSAGVLVIVSAISFSAGFASGREAGQLDANFALNSEANTLKGFREGTARYGLGFRRLRWTGATSLVHV